MADVRTLCRADELAPGEARRFDVDGHRIALARVGDAFHAVADRCSHADFSLAEGEVAEGEFAEAECTIECPRHGAVFSLITGEPRTLPATRPVAVYEVTVVDDEVRVVLP